MKHMQLSRTKLSSNTKRKKERESEVSKGWVEKRKIIAIYSDTKTWCLKDSFIIYS